MLRRPFLRTILRVSSGCKSSPSIPRFLLLPRNLTISAPLPPHRRIPHHSPLYQPHQQQHRTIFSSIRQRIQHERSTGNLRKLRAAIITGIVTTGVGLLLIIYGYAHYQIYITSTLHSYPPSVARELRRALYYNLEPSVHNRKETLRHLVKALERAKEEGMDPLSREVVGIRIMVATVCEDSGRRDIAVQVLGGVWGELVRGVDIVGIGLVLGSSDIAAVPLLLTPATTTTEDADTNKKEEEETDDAIETTATPPQPKLVVPADLTPQQRWIIRTGLIRRSAEIGLKLASLLSEENRSKESEQVLERVLEMIIGETQRRESRPPPPPPLPSPVDLDAGGESAIATATVLQRDPEGEWMTPLELASVFEATATHYLSHSRPDLSLPLFLTSLSHLPPTSAHAATVMTSISAALAEASSLPNPSTQQLPPADPMLKQSETWSRRAISVAEKILAAKPTSPGEQWEAEKEEAERALLAAWCNLGDVLGRMGSEAEARGAYAKAEEAMRKGSKALKGWEEGTSKIKEGRERWK